MVAEMAWGQGLAWYESNFAAAAASEAPAIGEASPYYTMFPHVAGVPERMASVIPDARLIYVVHHPVERMISSYLHSLRYGTETLPIDGALISRSHYADASRYAMQIEQYLRYFDQSQVLVVVMEDLAGASSPAFDRLLGLADLSPGWTPPDVDHRYQPSVRKRVPRAWWRKVGGLMVRGRVPAFQVPARADTSALTTRAVSQQDGALSPEVRKRLEEVLRPDVERLLQYAPEGFDGWGLLS